MTALACTQVETAWLWIEIAFSTMGCIVLACIAWAIVYHHVTLRKYYLGTEGEE